MDKYSIYIHTYIHTYPCTQVRMYAHVYILYSTFLRAKNFVNGLEKEVRENYFHESTLVSSLQSVICVTIEFLLIFGEIIFMEVPKSTKKFAALEKGTIQYINVYVHECNMYLLF